MDDGSLPPNAPAPSESRAAAAAPLVEQLSAVYDVPVQLSVVLGRATMRINQLVRLGRGAVVELDRKVGDPVDILVNNRLVARGQVTVIEDRLGITLTEVVKGS
jgi:flagellar motor switch protein FliN/FliY